MEEIHEAESYGPTFWIGNFSVTVGGGKGEEAWEACESLMRQNRRVRLLEETVYDLREQLAAAQEAMGAIIEGE
jgi:hypothetical protein